MSAILQEYMDVKGQSVSQSLFRKYGIPLLASLLLSMTAWMSVHLPFSLVPVGIQAHLIFFLAILLGKRAAFVAVTGLFLQAALGLPVLAGCSGGLHKFVGPTAGFLLFYQLSPLVVAPLFEKLKLQNMRLKVLITMSVATVVNFVFGATWLSTFVGWKGALLTGVCPFILGDIAKVLLFSSVIKTKTSMCTNSLHS